ncbi:MAG: DNA-directed RNA polymerase subunit beta', partial [Acidobacteriia bacterium]|nr:DNA-directed RNA polymerase subunit beta' [Terriglobia bacterium]
MFRSTPYDRVSLISDFDSIRIALASPEKIRSWSHGEVTKPETINYRTFKPERDGLFCAKIFGPVTDWECLCGKYKRMKHRGVICDKCGVEVTLSRVRRERLGHIELASPCSHVWFFKGLPSRIGQLLDITLRDLERVLYFEAFVVVQADEESELSEGDVLTDEKKRYLDQDKEKAGTFIAMMGAAGIKELLKKIDLDPLADELRGKMKTESSVQKKLKFARRLKVVESFRKSGNKPEWMVLDVIPVIPPELRPLVPLDGGRFATSDLNDLYRRVINRNNRLKKLMELSAPDVIVRNEKRMLQEAVDALFDNGRRGNVLRGANNRPLKSLSDTLKGKQGRFRQNLLGKRVDYSGRSVIVVGPELKLHQCGLPKQMALELFKPFIYQRLEQRGHCTTIKQAKELVEQQDPVVWDILEEVIKDHPVLLNRAPTLHRLGIQAFEPVLVEGKAIKIHPLVCTAFNADFDGDQMAVHIPLSPEAQVEAEVLMLSSNNILSPANGAPITTPTQDMVLGIYYLTKSKANAKGEGRTFGSIEEVLLALEMGEVETLTPIKLYHSGPVIDLTTSFDSQNVIHSEPIQYSKQYMDTTVGRVILNDRLPADMPFVNGLLKKRGLMQLVQYCYLHFGRAETVEMIDGLKNLGFNYATKAGLSIGINDMVVPAEKQRLVKGAQKDVMSVEQQYLDGAITHGERYNKIIEIWSKLTERVSDEMFTGLESSDTSGSAINPIYIMADSGARGSKQQIRQLSGMRGLMAKPSGEIIETPITANFREGLNVLQYFISTHGARKGLADTALKTADSGYLTRRLVDVAQDVIITETDCGTNDGIYVEPIVESGEVIEPLRDRIVGRVSQEQIKDYEGKVILTVNQEITEELAAAIPAAGIERVKIRSVLTCESERGVCRMCYGRNLATGRLVEGGEAVGVIAAQSIGEPGTQLTMRTFHIGGAATRVSEQSTQDAKSDGFAKFIKVVSVRNEDGGLVAMNRNGIVAVVDEKDREKERYQVVYGAKLCVEDGAPVSRHQVLLEWDPYTFSILTEVSGLCHFVDLQEGVTLQEQVDEVTGMSQWVVTDSPDEKRQPQIEIRDADGVAQRKYLIPTNAHLMVRDGEEIHGGDVVAKIPRETTKTKDITGGLPRVVELFEARRPKETAVMSEIDGMVRYGEIVKGQRKIFVIADNKEEREYSLPRGVHINVQQGERVRAGEPLMDGPRDPHDILAILGEKELQKYLVNEIQEVYRLQGVHINDKHLEVIVRQMMRWIKVEQVGDSELLLEEVLDKFRFRKINQTLE